MTAFPGLHTGSRVAAASGKAQSLVCEQNQVWALRVPAASPLLCHQRIFKEGSLSKGWLQLSFFTLGDAEGQRVEGSGPKSHSSARTSNS